MQSIRGNDGSFGSIEAEELSDCPVQLRFDAAKVVEESPYQFAGARLLPSNPRRFCHFTICPLLVISGPYEEAQEEAVTAASA